MDRETIQAGGGGAGAALLRAALALPAGGWWLAWQARRALHATGLRRVRSLPVPVLSVGNVAVGGTGKTPFVAWLARGLAERGRRPGILARGYGAPAAGAGGRSDEGAVLDHLLDGRVPQVEQPDRLAGGRRLLAEQAEVDVILLDDGFQHWRLARDLDIVLIDATRPFGHGHLLPRGLLREPLAALRRADVLVLTRTERVGERAADALARRLQGLADAPIARARTVATAVVVEGEREDVAWLAGQPVFACSGLGNPAAFEALLADLGADVRGRRRLRDHAPADGATWEAVRAEARACGASTIVVTRKDAVKRARLEDDVAILDVETRVGTGADELWAAVEGALGRAGAGPGT